MKTTRALRLATALVALLALGWAQAAGIHRGYMCECGCCGEALLTQVDHCHGPHSTPPHASGDHSIPHHHEEDDDDGDTHPHAAVIDSLLAIQHEADAFTAPLMPAGSADIRAFDILPILPAKTLTQQPLRRCRAAEEWPRRIAQVIALRI